MYPLDPPALFAHRRVLDNPMATARMERMVNAIGRKASDVIIITEDDMDQVAEACRATDDVADERIVRGGHGRYRNGWVGTIHDPGLVFSTFVMDPEQRTKPQKRYRHPMAQRAYALLCGVGREFMFSRRDLLHGEFPGGYVCQGGHGLHTLSGCLHKCTYCGESFVDVLQMDLEVVCDELSRMFVEVPQQKLYRWDVMSDTICYEPEYCGTQIIGDCFNRSDDKLLLLYSKSANFDHLLEFDYQQHVLSNWTIATERVCREIELNTPSLTERLAAMKRCQDAGYTVRCGFTPIIPTNGWREEATALIEQVFATVQPEVVRLWVVSMMECYEAEVIFGVDNLDPHALRRAREDVDRMSGQHHSPFPVDVRCEVYEWYLDELRRVSPETPVALCTETPEAWARLQPKLQMVPNKMFCCCGGTSVPGGWQGPLR